MENKIKLYSLQKMDATFNEYRGSNPAFDVKPINYNEAVYFINECIYDTETGKASVSIDKPISGHYLADNTLAYDNFGMSFGYLTSGLECEKAGLYDTLEDAMDALNGVDFEGRKLYDMNNDQIERMVSAWKEFENAGNEY